ncbi:MAG: transposase [bacterium]
MFRKTATDKQYGIFNNILGMLNGSARKHYEDTESWHNLFRKDVFSQVDESIFSVLFDKEMGAPNVSVRTVLSMMVLKEGFGWSDSQLFEQCHFNLLVRGAIGLVNIDDKVLAESTYYLFRKRVHEYCKKNGVDLIEKTFQAITKAQAIEFNVSGKSIRMDSKLIGSNVAWCSRYELIHETISHFCHNANQKLMNLLSEKEREQIGLICKEKGEKVVYRSNREDIQKHLLELGILMYKLTQIFDTSSGECYAILCRVFSEQYKIESEQVVLRPKEELQAENVQTPHDTDCTYRKKAEQEIKGYAVNLTETCDKGSLNLITGVQVENASAADNEFVDPGVSNTVEIFDRIPENLHTDGAYHSPLNASFCEAADINFYCTGMQGSTGRFDLRMTEDGLVVTDTKTGEIIPCEKLKSGSWKIETTEGYRYFSPEQIDTCERRRTIEELPAKIKNIRNNVEASIFQLSFHTRNNKTRYRGIIKHKLWATMRCLWINFRRIVKWVGKVCPKILKSLSSFSFILFFPVLIFLIQLFDQLFIPKVSWAKRKPILCENYCF